MEMLGIRPLVRPRYVVSALRFLFVDQLISNLHTSIILGISSLSSKLDKIFKMSAKTHQNFKVLQFQRKLIFRNGGHFGSYFHYGRQNT